MRLHVNVHVKLGAQINDNGFKFKDSRVSLIKDILVLDLSLVKGLSQRLVGFGTLSFLCSVLLAEISKLVFKAACYIRALFVGCSLPRVVLGQLVSHLLLVVQLNAVDFLVLCVKVLVQLSYLLLPFGVEVLYLAFPVLLSLGKVL